MCTLHRKEIYNEVARIGIIIYIWKCNKCLHAWARITSLGTERGRAVSE